MSWNRILVPFAAGLAVGVVVHRYRAEIREFAVPLLKRGLRASSDLLDKARTSFYEKSEEFADLVAEIREEEAAVPTPPAAT